MFGGKTSKRSLSSLARSLFPSLLILFSSNKGSSRTELVLTQEKGDSKLGRESIPREGQDHAESDRLKEASRYPRHRFPHLYLTGDFEALLSDSWLLEDEKGVDGSNYLSSLG